ncbi:MAG: fumarate reductase/succinate dehydrogenase flavoprotein subunit, partial [Cyanobium sp.]
GENHPACRQALAAVEGRLRALLAPAGAGQRSGRGRRPVDGFHRELGLLMIEVCGISRSGPRLRQAINEVEELRQRFAEEGAVAEGAGGGARGIHDELEKALRLQDFFGLADLMLRDALAREESCGAHFREEHQTAEGEALRDDANFSHIAAWEWAGQGEPRRHTEPLSYTTLTPSARSYR